MHSLHLRGKFAAEHWYRGKLIGLYPCNNDTTNEGKNRFLSVGFHGYPPITTWWLGLIDYVGYTALAATDIYRNINLTNGWSEYTTYTDTNNGNDATTRPLWTPDAAVGQSIANTTQSLFTITTLNTVKGLFVVGGDTNAQTKGDNASNSNSILWATALFGSDCPVFVGSVLRIIYTVNA